MRELLKSWQSCLRLRTHIQFGTLKTTVERMNSSLLACMRQMDLDVRESVMGHEYHTPL
jgi:hypothetical protein